MANGTDYRRDDRRKPWIAPVSWSEGERRRRIEKLFETKKQAQATLRHPGGCG